MPKTNNIEKLCRLSGLNPELENLEQLEHDLERNIEIVSALRNVKIRQDIAMQVAEDCSVEDIPEKFGNPERLRAHFPEREGNELKVKKVL